MLLQLVDVVGDPAPRLLTPKLVREIDFDGLTHCCDVARGSALFKARHGSMIRLMKLLLLLAAAAMAQPVAVAPPAVQPPATPAVWNPAAPYISAGQDEPGYRS